VHLAHKIAEGEKQKKRKKKNPYWAHSEGLQIFGHPKQLEDVRLLELKNGCIYVVMWIITWV
jgi:hypothetical protein